MEWWATYALYAKMCPDREHRFSSFVPERSSPVRFCVRDNDYITCNPVTLRKDTVTPVDTVQLTSAGGLFQRRCT